MTLRSAYPSLLWALLILILCVIPGEHIPHIKFIDWLKPDKVTHLVLFGVLSYLLIHAFQHSDISLLSKHPKLYAVMLSVVYGILIELLQEYVVIIHRSGQVLDAVADAAGAFIGLWVFNFLLRRSRRLGTKKMF